LILEEEANPSNFLHFTEIFSTASSPSLLIVVNYAALSISLISLFDWNPHSF